VVNATFGNPNLKPEKSQNSQVGIVYQPGWLAGFNMSIDYYRIGIKGQVGTVTQQTEINFCFTGLTQYCSAIVTKPPGTPLTVAAAPVFAQVNSQSYNIASTVTDGFNIAADYQFGLDDWGVPGNFAFRNLATNVSKFITNSGLTGAIPLETAGTNDGAIPHWKILATQNYDASGKWSFNFTETWISDGVHNRSWIQCTSGCPLPTVNNPTINDNHVPAIWYLAVGGSYNLSDSWQVYARVDNVMNKNAPPDGGNTQNPNEDGVNTQLYDDIGRMYHIGVRANF
jgi:iron complex outermembrane receptor protein